MTPYICPYTIGSEFSAILYPLPGQDQPPANVRLKVLQIFTFTKSQTMKIIISKSTGLDIDILIIETF
jgi:hypothetical protein